MSSGDIASSTILKSKAIVVRADCSCTHQMALRPDDPIPDENLQSRWSGASQTLVCRPWQLQDYFAGRGLGVSDQTRSSRVEPVQEVLHVRTEILGHIQ